MIERIFEVAPGDTNRAVIGAVEPRDFLGQGGFVVSSTFVLVKTERHGLEGAAFFSRQRCDDRRVHT